MPIDITKYFSAPGSNRAMYDDESNVTKYYDAQGNPLPSANLGQFSGLQASRDAGFPSSFRGYGANTVSSWSGASSNTYGIAAGVAMRMTPRELAAAQYANSPQAKESPFDPKTGLPTRLPQNAEEARQWQFQAAEWARKKNESMLSNAISSLRYGLGLAGRNSPFGWAQAMSPMIGQMANTYMNMQYQQPDYSYFLRSGEGGAGGFGGGRGGLNVGMQTQQQYGGQVAGGNYKDTMFGRAYLDPATGNYAVPPERQPMGISMSGSDAQRWVNMRAGMMAGASGGVAANPYSGGQLSAQNVAPVGYGGYGAQIPASGPEYIPDYSG